MATLDSLKRALRDKASEITSTPTKLLSDAQYKAGFDILTQGSCTYQDFIIPQLTRLLTPLFTHPEISVLEIGPGPKSVLGDLPLHLRQKIKFYTAFEPNELYVTELEEWLLDNSGSGRLFPNFSPQENPFCLKQTPFFLDTATGKDMGDYFFPFDLVLFCHSMYGMFPKRKFIRKAVSMLHKNSKPGLVVVFHRDGNMDLNLDGGLVCHRTASFPTGVVHVPNEKEALDRFASFIAGFVMYDNDVDKRVRAEWRQTCRILGDREESHPSHLAFKAPETMTAFSQHATSSIQLRVPLSSGIWSQAIKSQEARRHQHAAITRPNTIEQVQDIVRWALRNEFGLAVVGGGHSGHCLVSNVVSVDMYAFKKIHIVQEDLGYGVLSKPWVVVEAGCKAGDIVKKMREEGVTIPMGSRPSVGAGLWLQGGIGHQSGQLGLTCDAIVGAVVVSVDSAKVFCVGKVPAGHQPANSVRPEKEKEEDLLWALKGAGTNFGIVVSVVFQTAWARSRDIHEWVVPINPTHDAKAKLMTFASLSQRPFSHMYIEGDHYQPAVDGYLFWNNDQLHLGVTLFEPRIDRSINAGKNSPIYRFLGTPKITKDVDDVELFDSDMYLSTMHGGHGGGKTSSFKRCVFLKSIDLRTSAILVEAIETRPTDLCYLHLLPGRGAISKVAASETAFGCRDWDFACVITGIWPRDDYDSKIARTTV